MTDPRLKRTGANFSAGPSQLPREILIKAQDEMLNWKNTGSSVMEVSHRSAEFEATMKKLEEDFRKLLNIPKNYKVMFMQGGATLQFAAIPMNMLKGKKTANYLVTGAWSEKAAEEAKKYCNVNLVTPIPKPKKYQSIPSQDTWKVDQEGAYFYYCDNETIDGVEFDFVPNVPGQTLICDMSSNFGTKPIDFTKFGVVYGGAQKNLGPAGIAIVIVREDLIDKNVMPITPIMCNWKVALDNGSMYNTPPTFVLYMIDLNIQYMLSKGGMDYYTKFTADKAKLIYDAIDGSKGFYINPVAKNARSKINLVFRIRNDEKLENEFAAEAKKLGMIELKGHRSVGGMRASLYNGMPLESVVKLRDLMIAFQKKKESQPPAAKL